MVAHVQNVIALQLHGALDHDRAAAAVQPALVRRHHRPHQAVVADHLVEALRVGPKLRLPSLHTDIYSLTRHGTCIAMCCCTRPRVPYLDDDLHDEATLVRASDEVRTRMHGSA